MARKRMFALDVVDTDQFIEMPVSSRLLYYELGMRADDDGFVDNWKKILLFSGLKEDDMKVLISKKYILPFDNGIIVIRHWRMNNYLQSDRKKETVYSDEKAKLLLDDSNVYNLYTNCSHSQDKDSIDKISIDNSVQVFKKPTVEEIKVFCLEKKYDIDEEQFFNFYESKGWMIGKNKMKNWKACVITWQKNNFKNKEIIPEWFDKEIDKKEATKENKNKMAELLEKYN